MSDHVFNMGSKVGWMMRYDPIWSVVLVLIILVGPPLVVSIGMLIGVPTGCPIVSSIRMVLGKTIGSLFGDTIGMFWLGT